MMTKFLWSLPTLNLSFRVLFSCLRFIIKLLYFLFSFVIDLGEKFIEERFFLLVYSSYPFLSLFLYVLIDSSVSCGSLVIKAMSFLNYIFLLLNKQLIFYSPLLIRNFIDFSSDTKLFILFSYTGNLFLC